MKKIILFLLLIPAMAYTQDSIITRGGDTLFVEISKNTAEMIQFNYPNESVVNEIYKKSIEKIIFSSGRVELCNANFKLPEINGEKDWEKVIITYLESDIKGMERVKEIKASSGWGGTFGSSLGYSNCIKSLKKSASKLKASVVYIANVPNEQASAKGGLVQIIGVAYK